MANANRVNGFTPVGYLNGADWDGRGRVYAIAAAVTNAIGVGDPVKLVAGADATYYLPCIDLGAASAPLIGVVLAIGTNPKGLGPWVDPTQLNNILFRPAGAQAKQYYALVADDPQIIFEAQDYAAAGAGAPFTQTAATKNANYNTLGAPAAPGYLSQAFIDNGTAAAANATYNFQLLGLKQAIDNAPGNYQKWLCRINNHFFKAGVAGV
jgi:hypothetical protein